MKAAIVVKPSNEAGPVRSARQTDRHWEFVRCEPTPAHLQSGFLPDAEAAVEDRLRLNPGNSKARRVYQRIVQSVN